MTTPAAVLRIYEIIRADVCGVCEVKNIPRDCSRHKRRCEAGYRRQAQAIYEQVVKPLEDRLNKMIATVSPNNEWGYLGAKEEVE